MPSELVVPEAPKKTVGEMSFDELRTYRTVLNEEEEKVSYWRRLVQFRLDLIAKQNAKGVHLSTADLVKALGSTGTGQRRQQLLSVDAQDELPQLPGLDELWTHPVDLKDVAGTARLVKELTAVEVVLSDYRRQLHERVDAATAELIARYKSEPSLSLSLFPVNVR